MASDRDNKKKYDPNDYAKVDADLKASGVPAFDYSRRVLSGTAPSKIAEHLDPKLNGRRVSRNLPGQKKSPIVLAMDVTGSGREVPGLVRDDLPQLMGLLAVQGYVEFPDLQFIFFGDMTCDQYPMQVSQFESAAEQIDLALRGAILEGGGGGQQTESYEAVMWWATHMNDLDCWKEGKKGTLIMIGDEMAYPYLYKDLANSFMFPGSDAPDDGISPMTAELAALSSIYHEKPNSYAHIAIKSEDKTNGYPELLKDIPLQRIVDECLDKYVVYFIICGGSSYYNDDDVLTFWRTLLGDEQVIKLPDPRDISEMAASLVGYRNGIPMATIQKDLLALSGDQAMVDSVTKTLALIGQSNIVSGGFTPPATGGSKAERL